MTTPNSGGTERPTTDRMPATDPSKASGESRYRRFRRWTYDRPFIGSVLLIVSAIFLALPTISDLKIGELILTVSTVSGVSTIVLAVLMGLCGVSALMWGHTRVIAGIAAMVIALVAFPAANFGGYLLGTLFGIIGSSLILAWKKLPPAEEEQVLDALDAEHAPAVAPATATPAPSAPAAAAPTSTVPATVAPTPAHPATPAAPLTEAPAVPHRPAHAAPVHKAPPASPDTGHHARHATPEQP